MSFFKNILSQISERIIRNADTGRIMVEAANRRGDRGGGSISSQIAAQALSVQVQNLKKWMSAIQAATDPDNPDRTQLQQLYYILLLDNHVRSLFESRILFTQRSPIKMVDEKGNENKEISWLLERPWFYDIMYKTIFAKAQGCTLIEMYNLTPEGELDFITEIPQSNFNAKKGIILKEAGDSNGWNYREGVFTNFYVQVGQHDDLGMLEKLAPVILAKKLAMGSNLDYIEKYGVPPLFITTDREDDGRLKELYEAAVKFKSNQFMIARGNEKFEIGKDMGTGTAPFLELMNYCNDEISKAILGGSGITDEKAFVGSAEIQYKLAKDRMESDKLLFKFIFNTHIKPRLVNLSPIYAPFANHYLEWDNSEPVSQKDMIDTILKLSAQFDIDPEFVEQVSGVPILGVKNTALPGGEPEKK